ncbi:hypothetical protein [Pontibacter sp. G13]|uniref:hypothetical protein n=1 Tax=Pontibacter sp. G13 TaxID=3074898 RepID=UPI00288ACF48|nr:hypothetical protein [Pontibacter sp. G13]WNJ20495.1 hypothetical protein RJD25_08435 [Pontibacter sp. G13]
MSNIGKSIGGLAAGALILVRVLATDGCSIAMKGLGRFGDEAIDATRYLDDVSLLDDAARLGDAVDAGELLYEVYDEVGEDEELDFDGEELIGIEAELEMAEPEMEEDSMETHQ